MKHSTVKEMSPPGELKNSPDLLIPSTTQSSLPLIHIWYGFRFHGKSSGAAFESS